MKSYDDQAYTWIFALKTERESVPPVFICLYLEESPHSRVLLTVPRTINLSSFPTESTPQCYGLDVLRQETSLPKKETKIRCDIMLDIMQPEQGDHHMHSMLKHLYTFVPMYSSTQTLEWQIATCPGPLLIHVGLNGVLHYPQIAREICTWASPPSIIPHLITGCKHQGNQRPLELLLSTQLVSVSVGTDAGPECWFCSSESSRRRGAWVEGAWEVYVAMVVGVEVYGRGEVSLYRLFCYGTPSINQDG